jgi:hypothetical protein
MTLLALAVGQPSDGKQIGRIEEADAVVERQPFTGPQLVVDVGQPGRVKA